MDSLGEGKEIGDIKKENTFHYLSPSREVSLSLFMLWLTEQHHGRERERSHKQSIKLRFEAWLQLT